MEELARGSLTREGFRALAPRVKFRDSAPRPLFSRYVFVWIDDAAPWYGRMWRVRGVSRIVGGENPHPVQDGWVERVIPHLVDGVLALERPSDFLMFVPGDRVSVVSGVLAGMTGTCVWSSVSDVVVEIMTGSLASRRVRMAASSVAHTVPRETEPRLPWNRP